MANTIVSLSKRYEAHGEHFDTVEVRAPRFNDFIDLGEPFEAQRSPAGGTLVIENTEVVASYVRRCIVKPTIDKLGVIDEIADARAIREAVLDFFSSGKKPSAT